MVLDKVINGDCLDVLKQIPDNSVDAVVTDPPAGIAFMGKSWDRFKNRDEFIAFIQSVMTECYRILKPGGHAVVWALPKTSHWTAMGIENAGFEIRDVIHHIFASGFPKSYNIAKGIDAKLRVGKSNPKGINQSELSKDTGEEKIRMQPNNGILGEKKLVLKKENADLVTPEAKKWQGYGTALKPAVEHWILARKPLSEKTVVENVLKWGTGGLDIDGTRIPTKQGDTPKNFGHPTQNFGGTKKLNKDWEANIRGRFPANVVVQDDALNDGEMTKSGYMSPKLHKRVKTNRNGTMGVCYGKYNNKDRPLAETYGDSGSKSRYFDIDLWAETQGILQIPKASKKEKNLGLEGFEKKQKWLKGGGGTGITARENVKMQNNHPTVKPVKLMLWLVKLVSKEGDIVVDPFGGSGTTGMACKMLKRHYILIEKEKEYCEIARARIDAIQGRLL